MRSRCSGGSSSGLRDRSSDNLSAASLEMEGFSYDANALAEKFRAMGAVAWWC